MLSAKDTEKVLMLRASVATTTSFSSKGSYAAAAGTAFFGLELQEWGVIISLLIAILTLTMNFYFQRKKFNLDVLLAHSQLEKVATAAVDENQRALFEKMRDELVAEFGNVNQRENGDRRKNSNPNYNGVERRKGVRRKSVSGDTEAAKALSIVAEVTKAAVREMDEVKGDGK